MNRQDKVEKHMIFFAVDSIAHITSHAQHILNKKHISLDSLNKQQPTKIW